MNVVGISCSRVRRSTRGYIARYPGMTHVRAVHDRVMFLPAIRWFVMRTHYERAPCRIIDGTSKTSPRLRGPYAARPPKTCSAGHRLSAQPASSFSISRSKRPAASLVVLRRQHPRPAFPIASHLGSGSDARAIPGGVRRSCRAIVAKISNLRWIVWRRNGRWPTRGSLPFGVERAASERPLWPSTLRTVLSMGRPPRPSSTCMSHMGCRCFLGLEPGFRCDRSKRDRIMRLFSSQRRAHRMWLECSPHRDAA